MNRSLNQVTLVGNLTRDPEMRATSSGDEVCRFGLALGYTYNTSDGQTHDGVDFVDVVAWGSLASIVSTYCHKGKQVLVSGKLKSSSWEQDGQKRSKLEVRASNVLLLGSAPAAAAGDQQAAPAKGKTKAAPATAETDYEATEDYDYEPEGVDPQDIPF